MGRNIVTDTDIDISIDTTELVPLGAEFPVTLEGKIWAKGGDIISASEYPKFAAEYPTNLTVSSDVTVTTGHLAAQNILAHSSGFIVSRFSTESTIALSLDNGVTWSLRVLPEASTVSSFTELNSTTILGHNFSSSYVLRSTNGKNWTKIVTPIPAQVISQISTGRIFILHDSSTDLIYSDDDGLTWNSVTHGLTGGKKIFTTNLGTLVLQQAGTSNLARSTDNGLTWGTITTPLASFIDLEISNTGRLFINNGTPAVTNIAYSDDDGLTWTGVTVASGQACAEIIALPSGRILTRFLSYLFIPYSDDDGLTWTGVAAVPAAFSRLGIFNNGGRIILSDPSANGTTSYSDDEAVSWSSSSTGLSNISTITEINAPFIICTSNVNTSIAHSNDNGTTWSLISTGLTTSVDAIFKASNSDLITLTDGPSINISISTNGGTGWTGTSSGLLRVQNIHELPNGLIIASNSFTGGDSIVQLWRNNSGLLYIEPPTTSTNFIRIE